MSLLTNKKILILSPQSWGKMFVSKHHYAIELAKRGNKVYYLNPPNSSVRDSINIERSELNENLFIINHRLNFSYNLKFRLLTVFHLFMRFHVRKIIKSINEPIDIVWSFDLGYLYPFRFFEKISYKVFHPVDEPLIKIAIDSGQGSDIIFSVTHEILEKYAIYSAPRYFINHGVSSDFLLPVNRHAAAFSTITRVGFSGNLLRGDIDRKTLLEIIYQNPTIIFEFWGSFSVKDANIGGATDIETVNFIDALQKHKNVILHGAIASNRLATALRDMDAFLICYDIEKDQSKGTNYHKVMEYLSTGRVIISNNITTYKDRPDLIQMTTERQHNNSLPALFKMVIENISEHNNEDKQLIRINFAADNSYSRQIARIEEKLSIHVLHKSANL